MRDLPASALQADDIPFIAWLQNTFSLAHMGVLAREHFMDEGTACTEPGGSDSAATHAKPTLNYLRELLGSEVCVVPRSDATPL